MKSMNIEQFGPASGGNFQSPTRESSRPLTQHASIPGLKFGSPTTAPHVDQRRVLGSIFNGDFIARQGKYLNFSMECVAGGHSHTYDELTFVITGEHKFEFVDLRSDRATSEQRHEILLRPGEILIVPAGVAHRGFHPENSMIFAFTEEPYISAQNNDIPYQF